MLYNKLRTVAFKNCMIGNDFSFQDECAPDFLKIEETQIQGQIVEKIFIGCFHLSQNATTFDEASKVLQ